MRTRAVSNAADLIIPPGAPNVRSDAYFTLPEATRIISFQPHMHYRGKAMTLEAIRPGSATPELLSDVDRFAWDWQPTYVYETPLTLPAGTVMHVTAYHDNSAANRVNPDPDAAVGWGQRTIDEMNIGWLDYFHISEAEYAELQGGGVAAVRWAAVVLALAGAVAASAAGAQPRHPVYLIYDGFITNADGSRTLAFGYHNVNHVDVTVAGDDNAFLTGAADRSQPTVFRPGRHRFACVMVVPDGLDARLQWRVRFAGHTSTTTPACWIPCMRSRKRARCGRSRASTSTGRRREPAWSGMPGANDPGSLRRR